MLTVGKDGFGPYLDGREQVLQNIAVCIATYKIITQDPKKKVSVRRRAAQFFLWEGYLYKRLHKLLIVVISRSSRTLILRSLHNELRQWDVKATNKTVTNKVL